MKYVKVQDPEDVAQASLKTEAAQKEELAYSAELGEQEVRALVSRDLADQSNIEQARLNALAARREANVYATAAGLTDDEIKQIRLSYLNRWQEFTERNHIQHSAVLKVKAELGEPTASYDDILARLDVAHELATKRISEMSDKPPRTNRSTPKKKN